MRTLTRYLTGSFLLTFSVSLMVVTFVMCIGIVFKVTDLIARGVPWQPVMRVLGYGLPEALTFSIPISVLTGCLLVYGRLSADGEITAMRASGVNLWHVVQGPCLLAVLLSVLCAYINNEIVPRGHLARRQEVARLGVSTPLELVEEGRFIQDFPGFTLYIGKRRNEQLYNVRIYDLRKENVRREIRASSGRMRASKDGGLQLDLTDVRIDPFADDRPGAAYMEQMTLAVPRQGKTGRYRPKEDDMTFWELVRSLGRARELYPDLKPEDLAQHLGVLRVELHRRLSISASCFAFAILGVPLGIKAHRKESSVGIGVSLILVVNFYVFVLIAQGLAQRPEWHSHVFAWVPIVLALVLGTVLIHRNN